MREDKKAPCIFKFSFPLLQADILLQGSLGKSILLETHRKKIANHSRSILFGLASFGFCTLEK